MMRRLNEGRRSFETAGYILCGVKNLFELVLDHGTTPCARRPLLAGICSVGLRWPTLVFSGIHNFNIFRGCHFNMRSF